MEMNHEHWNKSTFLKMLIFHWQNIQLFSVCCWNRRTKTSRLMHVFYICFHLWLFLIINMRKELSRKSFKVSLTLRRYFIFQLLLCILTVASTTCYWSLYKHTLGIELVFQTKGCPAVCAYNDVCVECVLEQLILPLCQESFYTLFVINTFGVTLCVFVCLPWETVLTGFPMKSTVTWHSIHT